jgi:hypothetical protein
MRRCSVAHLWIEDEDAAWTVFPLLEARYGLSGLPPRKAEDVSVTTRGVCLLMAVGHGRSAWVLIAPVGTHVCVNGWPLKTGLRVLADRDEVSVGGLPTFFFSSESLARIERLPTLDRAIFCARCKLLIEPDTPAVRCPSCHVWHHQDGDYPCWTYSESCTLCSQPTRLDTGYRWKPTEVWA